MMKKLTVLLLALAVLGLAGNAWAATAATCTTSTPGLWSDGTLWNIGVQPSTTIAAGDEIKISGTTTAGSDLTVDSTISADYACGISFAGVGTMGDKVGSPQTILRVTGGLLGANLLRFGNRNTSGNNGACGTAVQSGGTVSVNDLLLGQWTATGPSVAEGYYTISGGTLQAKSAGNGRLWVGGNSTGVGGTTSSDVFGKFTVVGNAATISMKKLYVGNGIATYGTSGTLEFQIAPAGVSRIQLSGAGAGVTNLDLAGSLASTRLLVSGAVMPAGDIVLVENLASDATIVGQFDTLNGGSAVEGAWRNIGGNWYQLTYAYAAGLDGIHNDIALVVPEPATLAILGLGGLLLRRRLA
jgi:hypothetical protein